MKKLVLSLAVIACIAITLLGLSSFASTTNSKAVATDIKTHNHVDSQGKHCNATVGCDCPGFSPITSGQEWQKDYCKHCGHSRSYHK